MIKWIAIGIGVAAVATSTGAMGQEDELLQRSRALVAEFARALRAELTVALERGGPVAAVKVCKDAAPALAAEFSRRSGAQVSRIGTRTRNPVNTPAPWQVEVLQQFSVEADREPLESFTRTEDETRYLSAISVAPPCLMCHGETIAPEVADTLAVGYPEDQATGYALNELRGAFSVVWPSGAAASAEPEATR